VRATYTALGSIVAVLALAHLLWGDQLAVVRDFAPELATEVLGILITLVFVQRIIDRRAQQDRARASRGGVRRSEDPLRDLSDLWTEIVRGCLEGRPASPPGTYLKLFGPEWSAAVDDCDLTRVRYAWSDETWAESAARVISRARDQISGILDVYGVHLNAHFIEVLDEIRDDPFLAHVETLGEQLRIARELFPDEIEPEDYAITRTSDVRSEFMGTISQAIRLYNEAALGEAPIDELPEGFWAPDRMPAPGTLLTGAPTPSSPDRSDNPTSADSDG
jgi:hypothetical protein